MEQVQARKRGIRMIPDRLISVHRTGRPCRVNEIQGGTEQARQGMIQGDPTEGCSNEGQHE